jgi:small subunit ribosomal protein S8
MSQDIAADTLNMLMNAKRANKNTVETPRYSKLLLSILAIAKMKGYIENYKVDAGVLKITIGQLNECHAIKPRFTVKAGTIEKYMTRYLPAKEIGIIILSTSQGLMTHKTAIEKNLGGCLLAYFY